MRCFLSLATCLFLAVATASLQADEVKVKVGGSLVTIPEPRGCAQLTSAQREPYETALSLVPKSNTLLAFFVTKADLDLIQGGRDPEFQYTLSAQVLKSLETHVMDLKGFKEFSEQLKNENQQIMAQVERDTPGLIEQINAQFASNATVALDGESARIVPMKPHEETPTSIVFTSLVSYSRPGASESVTVMVDTAIVLLNGKVVFLYFNSPNGQLETVRATAKEWRDTVLAANPAPPATSTTAEGVSQKAPNLVQRMLIGGIAGAVLGVIIGVIRGRRIKRGEKVG